MKWNIVDDRILKIRASTILCACVQWKRVCLEGGSTNNRPVFCFPYMVTLIHTIRINIYNTKVYSCIAICTDLCAIRYNNGIILCNVQRFHLGQTIMLKWLPSDGYKTLLRFLLQFNILIIKDLLCTQCIIACTRFSASAM